MAERVSEAPSVAGFILEREALAPVYRARLDLSVRAAADLVEFGGPLRRRGGSGIQDIRRGGRIPATWTCISVPSVFLVFNYLGGMSHA